MRRVGIVLVVGLVFFVWGAGKAAAESAEELKAKIWELRWSGRYEDALAVAQVLLQTLQADTAVKSFELRDGELLVETLELVSRMGIVERRGLAKADSLDAAVEELEEAGRYEDAAAVARRQLETRRRVLGREHVDVATNLNTLARLLRKKGDYDDAMPPFRETLAMRKKLLGTEHPDVAETLNDFAVLLKHKGNYAAAEPLLREALAIDLKLRGSEHLDVATDLNNLGLLFRDKGDYTAAEPLLREALAMDRRLLGNEHPQVARGLNNLAALLNYTGDYDGAEPLLREALAMFRKLLGNEHPDVATCLTNLAFLHKDKGEYDAAEPLLREAFAMDRRLLGNKNPAVARSLNSLAALLHDKGDYAAAEPFYREALAMRQELLSNEHPDVATSLNNLAVLFKAKGDYDAAEPLYREALTMRQKLLGNEHPQVATSLNNLAVLLKAKGDYDVAEALLREALAMYQKLLGDEHARVALSLHNLATLLRAQGDYDAAETLYRKTLAMRQRLLGSEHSDVTLTLRHLGNLLLVRGNLAGSDSMLTQASRSYETARKRAGSGLDRATFASSPYPDLALLRLRQDRPLEAWEAAEHAQARALADLLLASRQRPLPPDVAAREDSLRFHLANLERMLDVLRRTAAKDSTGETERELEDKRSDLLSTEADWSRFQRDLARRFPLTEGQPFPLNRIQAALPEDAALIGWLDVETEKDRFDSWAYVLRKTVPPRWAHLPGASGSPQARAHAIRSAVATPDIVSPQGPDTDIFYRERIAPIADALDGVHSLLVIPSGAMLGLPLEIVRDDQGQLLGERFTISYVPSATLFTWLKEKAKTRSDDPRSRPALLVGDPPTRRAPDLVADASTPNTASRFENLKTAFNVAFASVLRGAAAGNPAALDSLPPLVAARDEVQSLAALFKNREVLLGSNASEQNLTRLATEHQLSRFSVLHFATHALADDERPERSILVLSQQDLPDPLAAAEAGSRIYDGLLSAKEVLEEWKLDADLVTLSGCETGLGREVQGEGYIGLANAFVQAGARSLIVSLWPVEDQATGLLMQRFYANWVGAGGKRMGKTQALAEAKRWLREQTNSKGERLYEHPYYWASFILIGEAG